MDWRVIVGIVLAFAIFGSVLAISYGVHSVVNP